MSPPQQQAKLKPEDVLGPAPEIAPDVWSAVVRFSFFFLERRTRQPSDEKDATPAATDGGTNEKNERRP